MSTYTVEYSHLPDDCVTTSYSVFGYRFRGAKPNQPDRILNDDQPRKRPAFEIQGERKQIQI